MAISYLKLYISFKEFNSMYCYRYSNLLYLLVFKFKEHFINSSHKLDLLIIAQFRLVMELGNRLESLD